MHAAEHSLLERRLQVKHIVNAQAVADGRRDITHPGQILTQRHHIHPVVASGQKEASVREDDHWPVHFPIPCRAVYVHVQFHVGSRRARVGTIKDPLRDLHLIEHPVSVSDAVALSQGGPDHAHPNASQDPLTHRLVR